MHVSSYAARTLASAGGGHSRILNKQSAISTPEPRGTGAGGLHETPAQRPSRRSRETPLFSRPGADYRPRKSALITTADIAAALPGIAVRAAA